MNHTLEQLRSGQLIGTQRLNLACGLTEFPREIFDLADTLEILDLSGNALSSLPDDLPRLHKLRVLFCSNNQFVALPEILGQCAQLSMIGFKANRIRTVAGTALPATLRWLILTDNQIEDMPVDIGRCTQLQKLMLAGNRLSTLPVQLSHCSRLELLRISANRFVALPDWLLSMPRLSWLAFAGNPFCEERERVALAESRTTDIRWSQLQVHNQLGEGASGIIYRAEYQCDDGLRAVALKLFKGEMTSDGLPRSEMAACISAGAHPALIAITGTLIDHPAGASGLVMPLIDPAFRILAGPPSLASCTRDTYSADTVFDPATLLGIAQGIASAAMHLHAQGILHGDLYGHNILHCGGGNVLLGDFGAASLFGTGSSIALSLQRLEVRAFGCLLDELVERCEVRSDDHIVIARLAAVAASCLQRDNLQRPLFEQLVQEIFAITELHQASAR
ncbi:leucine-rich repeat-containing protein kinase family protein [Actimicrobium antarcticum]|uniref:leucine-rich repeat-containing protein kinase family protein n=1 Tax=Actimicrobium antarcticum TaxID=1051899 RepID=UPI0031D904AB